MNPVPMWQPTASWPSIIQYVRVRVSVSIFVMVYPKKGCDHFRSLVSAAVTSAGQQMALWSVNVKSSSSCPLDSEPCVLRLSRYMPLNKTGLMDYCQLNTWFSFFTRVGSSYCLSICQLAYSMCNRSRLLHYQYCIVLNHIFNAFNVTEALKA